jgi:hypothetical protein
MKYEQELNEVFNTVTVDFPGHETLKVTTLDNFKIGVSKLIELAYTEGVTEGVGRAHETVVESINKFFKL